MNEEDKLYTISIIGPAKKQEDIPDQLRNIAELIEQGYTSGYYPSWELVEVKGEE